MISEDADTLLSENECFKEECENTADSRFTLKSQKLSLHIQRILLDRHNLIIN